LSCWDCKEHADRGVSRGWEAEDETLASRIGITALLAGLSVCCRWLRARAGISSGALWRGIANISSDGEAEGRCLGGGGEGNDSGGGEGLHLERKKEVRC
jgi:hypothetical protein